MSKVAFISDIHVGNHGSHGGTTTAGLNQRCREILLCLGNAMQLCAEKGVTDVFIAGDIFDTAKPSPQMIASVQEALAVDCVTRKMSVHLMMGNHDRQSGLTGDHALGPMVQENVIELPEPVFVRSPKSEGRDSNVLVLPFRAEPCEQWVPQEVAKWVNEGYSIRALVLHAGIYTDDDVKSHAWDVTVGNDVISRKTLHDLQVQYEIPFVFAGNWHARRVFDSREPWASSAYRQNLYGMYQIGALVPTGWDNPSLTAQPWEDIYGSVFIVDFDDIMGRNVELHCIPGPRFVSPTSISQLDEMLAFYAESSDEYKVYARMNTSAGDMQKALVDLGIRQSRNTQLVGIDVRVDQDKARETARVSARIAGSRELLQETVGEFVKSLTPPTTMSEEDFRKAVTAKVWEHLA